MIIKFLNKLALLVLLLAAFFLPSAKGGFAEAYLDTVLASGKGKSGLESPSLAKSKRESKEDDDDGGDDHGGDHDDDHGSDDDDHDDGGDDDSPGNNSGSNSGTGGNNGNSGNSGNGNETTTETPDSNDAHKWTNSPTTASGGKNIRPTSVAKLANGARVTFSDGSITEISNGQFRRINASGRVVERRRAQGTDVARMRAYFESMASKTTTPTPKPAPKVNAPAVRAFYRGQNIEIVYANGWREMVSFGQYSLTDQFGRSVASRKATQADITRLNQYRK